MPRPRSRDRNDFDPGARYTARRVFTSAGVRYEPGDEVEVRYDLRRFKLLFQQHVILKSLKLPTWTPEPTVGGPVLLAPVLVGEVPQESTVPVAPTPKRVIHELGGGWFRVYDERGVDLTAKAMRRDEAEALAASGVS